MSALDAAPSLLFDEVQDLIKDERLKAIGGEDVFDAYERYHREHGNDEKARGNDQHREKMTAALAAPSAGAGWVSPEAHAASLRIAREETDSFSALVDVAARERDAALAVKAQLLGALGDIADSEDENGVPSSRSWMQQRARDAIAAAKGGAA
jgi:hypothetical protein